jgi:predicted nucleic acid-binding protein
MAPGCFLDTNLLLDAITSDPAEHARRDRARWLLQEDDWTVSVQVLQEFYVQATRPSRRGALTGAEARRLIHSWERFSVQPITVEVMERAMEWHERFPLSYWDAAILSAAQQAGCDLVLSEDMGDGMVYGNVLVRNPMRGL